MARARVGEITDEQYRFELERLRNPNAASLQPGAVAATPPETTSGDGPIV
jgi:hypothetical protein